jgi:diguanylate cyclase (GGDEF)-like protein
LTTDVARHLDVATGAWKRSHFEELLATAVQHAHRAAEPLCLMYFDVDELQEHNDRLGRERLDAAVSMLATVIADELDGRGPIGRIDGDAFCAFLGRVSLSTARELAERIRRSASTRLLPLPHSPRVTICVGVAQLLASEPWGNLFEAAEQACVRAKQQGRNAVACR